MDASDCGGLVRHSIKCANDRVKAIPGVSGTVEKCLVIDPEYKRVEVTPDAVPIDTLVNTALEGVNEQAAEVEVDEADLADLTDERSRSSKSAILAATLTLTLKMSSVTTMMSEKGGDCGCGGDSKNNSGGSSTTVLLSSFFCSVVLCSLRTCVSREPSGPRRPDHHRYASI